MVKGNLWECSSEASKSRSDSVSMRDLSTLKQCSSRERTRLIFMAPTLRAVKKAYWSSVFCTRRSLQNLLEMVENVYLPNCRALHLRGTPRNITWHSPFVVKFVSQNPASSSTKQSPLAFLQNSLSGTVCLVTPIPSFQWMVRVIKQQSRCSGEILDSQPSATIKHRGIFERRRKITPPPVAFLSWGRDTSPRFDESGARQKSRAQAN
jgi:hypothetical protein